MKVRSKQEVPVQQTVQVQNVAQPQVVQQAVPPTTTVVSNRPDYKNVWDLSQDETRIFYYYPNSNIVLCEPNCDGIDPAEHWVKYGKQWKLLAD